MWELWERIGPVRWATCRKLQLAKGYELNPPKPWIGVNDQGRRVGESHPRADLTDHEVEMMRRLHEEEGWGYRKLGKAFDLPRDTCRDICKYRRRGQTATRYKRGA